MKNIELGPILKKLSYGPRIRPARDWFVLLSITIVLLIASVLWNLWLLKSVEQGGTIGNEAPPPAFDAAPIESVRTLFESRSAEEARFRQEYRFVDPSR